MDSAILRMAEAGDEIYLADSGKVMWRMGLDQDKESLNSVWGLSLFRGHLKDFFGDS